MGDLRGAKDTCNAVSMLNKDGLIDDGILRGNCPLTTDTAGNKCVHVPIEESEKAWKMWSILEIGAFTSSYVVQALMVFTWLSPVEAPDEIVEVQDEMDKKAALEAKLRAGERAPDGSDYEQPLGT